MKKVITCSFLILMSYFSFAQVNLDSLWTVWSNESLDDTTRLNALHEYTVEGYLKGQPDSSYFLAQIQHNYAQSKGLSKYMADALIIQGRSFKEKGNYPAAIEYYEKSITISEGVDDKKKIAEALNHIGYGYQRLSNYETASIHFKDALKLSEEIGDKWNEAILLGDIGYNYFYRSEYPKAISFLKRSLKLNEEVGNTKEVAGCWLRLGNINYDQGHKIGAIEAYQKSLAYYEEIGNIYGVGSCLNNIGNIYSSQGDYAKALEYYKRDLGLSYESEVAMATPLHNVGRAFSALGKTDSAFVYFEQSLNIRKKTANRRGIASSYHSIGGLYENKGEYNSALNFYEQSLKIREEIGNKSGISSLLTSIGIINNLQNRFNYGIKNCEKGYLIALEMNDIYRQKFACECLYKGYKSMGDGNKALEYLERMAVLKDSLQSGETMKQLQQMEFQKQILADSIAIAEEQFNVQEAHNSEMRAKEKIRNISIGTALFFFFAAGGYYSRYRYLKKSKATIEKERDRSDNLLLNILPEEIAKELKEKGKAPARNFEKVSILFTDFKDFTETSSQLSAQDLVEEINICFEAFDHILSKYKIEKIKTIGDAYMAAGGLPIPTRDSVKNTVLAALEMQSYIKSRKVEKDMKGLPAFEMRAGIHTGPIVAGIVGVKKFQYDVWGDTVNTASRMESQGKVNEVNISQVTQDILKDDPLFSFENRGHIDVKGKGEMEMWFVKLK